MKLVDKKGDGPLYRLIDRLGVPDVDEDPVLYLVAVLVLGCFLLAAVISVVMGYPPCGVANAACF